jgi:hypothetical protein
MDEHFDSLPEQHLDPAFPDPQDKSHTETRVIDGIIGPVTFLHVVK